MKQTSKVIVSVTALFVASLMGGTAFADLNATEIANNFNASNGGAGWQFGYSSSLNLITLTTYTTAYDNIDNSAYVSTTGGTTSGRTWFETFCVEPTTGVGTPMVAKLNYSGGQSKNSNGVALNLGAAYLYKQFATGTLSGFNYSGTTSNGMLANAIRVVLGFDTLGNWASNTFLAQLLAENSSQAYWVSSYDPGQYYSEIGNYSVFIMNVYSTAGANRQDFLYIAKANGNGGSDVPEPASILLWSLGGLGLAGSWARKRRLKKLATN